MFTKFRLSSNQLCFLIVFAFTTVLFVINGCHENTPAETLEQNIADGKELAKKYCVSCHQLPDPSLIDRKSWANGVLPANGETAAC